MSEGETSEGAELSPKKLKKSLKLFDVYAICTGAMFSSGFFLLPGIAAAESGPSVVLAYLLSGLLILPATLCVAELATAMPKAGGAYYYLDRSLGPLIGTAGGFGTWIALVLKSAFALVGMGAYLALFVELPIKPVAVSLIAAFTVLNIVGAKETSGLQRILVATLVAVLTYFVVQGLFELGSRPLEQTRVQFEDWMPFGWSGLFSTIGLVFVSYAGLTKVASVSEEVENPDRNIPLGMLLSLATAMIIYTLGVFVMVGVLEPSAFREDLTPVATAGQEFFNWLPGDFGLYLIVIAAVAAFASTGNAGIMSASRYPLAMARDRLVPSLFARIGRFDTPTIGILLTSGIMTFAVVVLDVATLAKLASAVQLVLFGMLCLAVIVMRESQIEYYQPGFNVPLYPWLPLIGVLIPFWLIAEMGPGPMLFSGGLIVLGVIWYFAYSVKHTEREGAIYHVFERLGRRRDDDLQRELRLIMSEKGLSEEDSFEEVVAEANLLDIESGSTFGDILSKASRQLEERAGVDAEALERGLLQEIEVGLCPGSNGVIVPHLRIGDADHSHMLLAKTDHISEFPPHVVEQFPDGIDGFIFFISPVGRTGEHLRILAQIAGRIDEDGFREEWLEAESEPTLKMLLLRDERFYNVRVKSKCPSAELINKRVYDVDLPPSTLIALVRRHSQTVIPRGDTTIREGDEVIFIGNPESIDELHDRFDEN